MKKIIILLLIIFTIQAKIPVNDHEFIELFNRLSPEGQKPIKTILFEACAFGKIKKDSKKSLAKEALNKAFQLWQEVTDYTQIKLQHAQEKISTEQLKKTKEKYQQTFNELQKIVVPQSRHFFESSNIIKTTKSTYSLHPLTNAQMKNAPEKESNWIIQIKNLYQQILSKIKSFFEKPSPIKQRKEFEEIEQILELITYAIKTSQTWLEKKPDDSYKKNPFCILNNSIN